MTLTKEQIVAVTKAAAKRATMPGFAATPIQERHVKRFEELKRRREAGEAIAGHDPQTDHQDPS